MPYESSSNDLRGTYSWQLLFDIDNSSNDGEIRRTETVKSCLSVNRKHLMEAVFNTLAEVKVGSSFEMGAKPKVVDISIKAGMTTDISMQAVNELKTVTEQSESKTIEEITTTEITIGKRSKLRLYRLIFNGPGMSYATPTLSSEPHKMDDVILSCRVETLQFLKDIKVVFTDDEVSMPHDCIQEVHGLDSNVNAGYGGIYRYTWLVPIWTANPDEGVTSIKVVVQRSENSSFQDLKEGVGGGYHQYLKMIRDQNSKSRITKLGLWKDNKMEKNLGSSKWNGWTEDIHALPNSSSVMPSFAVDMVLGVRALGLSIPLAGITAIVKELQHSSLFICWENTLL